MADEARRPLKVFLCHASGDKPVVRELYKRLIAEGVDAWLDQEKLLPGQDWRVEIPRAVKEADVVVICLSNKSITKEGYVQKEIKFALDSAEEKPEGTIFLIPARLEDCVVPEGLNRWHWVDLFEEYGFMRLLRSLKLRADRVGAIIEPLGYESEDQEMERRLDQLYTEGLAAFWVEDWDRACQRFQMILRERPNDRNAAEKLAQAERQRSLAKLYVEGTEAYQSENWADAIKALEGLLEKSADYKDAVQLLKDAKKQSQLSELYTEAKRLHAAQKWQAVIKVFEQITVIEPNYPDPEGLLTSAQQEAAELKRLADLTELYRQGVHQMDAGNWYEARQLLEQVHKAQIGFLDTERLLRKVENEVIRIEELKKRNDQINTLYEQAHGLIRSKSWRMVLDKLEEIQRLDDQFVDRDGIFEKARTELAQEEQAAQRQNEVAAMYAESVRLLKEGKYQEALDTWQEVKAIDPKYPDRQRVQSIARRKLTESAVPPQIKPHPVLAKPVWIGIIGLAVIALVVNAISLSRRNNEEAPPLPITTLGVGIAANPTMTIAPGSTDIPQASATTAPTVVSDPFMYDDFDSPANDGKFNTSLWNPNLPVRKIFQQNGSLTLEVNDSPGHIGLWSRKTYHPDSPIFIESRIMLDPTSRKDAAILVHFGTAEKGDAGCTIFADETGTNTQYIVCSSEFVTPQKSFSVKITPGTWHTVRTELYPDTMTFVYIVDGQKIGSDVPQNPDELKDLTYVPLVFVDSGTDSAPGVTGYADYVKMGKIEEFETKQTAYRWDFNNDSQGWDIKFANAISTPKTLNGYLGFKTTGFDPWIASPRPLQIYASTTPVITLRMRVSHYGDWFIYFLTNKDDVGNDAKTVKFSIRKIDAFETYHILMSTNPAWNNTITEFRFDPPDDDRNVQIEIDYISVRAR